MTKKHIIFILALAIFFSSAPLALAEEENNAADTTIEQLLEQIKILQEQIQTLQQQIQQLREQQQTLHQEMLTLTRQLQEGMQGEDVKLLQKMLATDPDIYPEGLVTGYFGPMTKRAVQRFQEKAGIDQAGRVGPQTLTRINDIFKEGVEGRGVGLEEHEGVLVPPGLLRAPGIIRLMGEDHPRFPELSDSADENGDPEEEGEENDEEENEE